MRTGDSLTRGLDRLGDLRQTFLATGLADDQTAYNLTWHDWLNMRSLIEISETIAKAALWRENSRGAHFREDFADEGDLDTSYFTVARQGDDNAVNMTREAVDFSIVKPGESLLEEEPEALAATA